MLKFFAEKMWVSYSHFFSKKYQNIESAKTVNEMTLNELVKLTMLWTTGPCSFSHAATHNKMILFQYCSVLSWTGFWRFNRCTVHTILTTTLLSRSFCSGLFHLWIWSEPLFQTGVSVKNQNRMSNSVDPDEMAHHEPSHYDLHCLQKCSFDLQGWNG